MKYIFLLVSALSSPLFAAEPNHETFDTMKKLPPQTMPANAAVKIKQPCIDTSIPSNGHGASQQLRECPETAAKSAEKSQLTLPPADALGGR